jgi:catalase
MKQEKTLTTESGAPVADNQNSLTAGPRGPRLQFSDFIRTRKRDPKTNLRPNPTAVWDGRRNPNMQADSRSNWVSTRAKPWLLPDRFVHRRNSSPMAR